jgi:Transposase, Mutator family
MPHKATIESLPRAFEMVKAMQADGLERGEGYRPLGRQALAEIIEEQMAKAVEAHLEQLEADDAADRRNGYYQRHLLTELGDIELNVPRTRRYSPVEVIRAYARRTPEIDRVILSAFVLGLSTRKVGETLLAILGRPISAETVSQVAKTLDVAVAPSIAGRCRTATRCSCLMAWCLPARPAPVRSVARFWLLWACARMAKRRSSTSAWPGAKAPPNGRSSSPIFTVAGSPARGSTWSASMVAAACRLPADRPARHSRAALLGSQDQEHPRQSPQGRPAQRQARTPQGHECPQPVCSAIGRPPLRRSLRGRLPQCGCMPARRPRRTAHLLPLQIRGATSQGTNHQRHRTTLPRSPATDQAHGHLPGQNQYGSYPVRRLLSRKQITGRQYLFPADT